MANSSVSQSKPARNEHSNGGGRPLGAEIRRATSTPTYDDIAQRAYQIYEREGRLPGRDIENWLQAENELGLRGELH